MQSYINGVYVCNTAIPILSMYSVLPEFAVVPGVAWGGVSLIRFYS